MSEEVKTTYDMEEEDPILPSGWKEGDDFFQSDTWTGDTDSADEPGTDSDPSDDDAEDNPGDDPDPTKADNDPENSQNADDDPKETQPDGGGDRKEDSSKTYRLRVNHQDREVTLSEDEVIARLQKSYAWDQMQEQKTRAKYKATYQEQIDAGLTPAAARLVAQNECGGKSYEIGEDGEIVDPDPESKPEETTEKPPAAAPSTQDLAAQIEQVKAIFGDFAEVPEEVARAVSRGADLFTAYTAYRLKESSKAAASLKKENEVLKQNAASAARAPVRGVSGGGDTKQKRESDFLKGFNSEEW